jgi:hypothetical protein
MNDSPSPTGARQWLGQIDRLLRGGFTGKEQLKAGRIEVPVRTLVIAGAVFGAIYGVTMGLYAVGNRGFEGLAQLVFTTIKVPLLFLLTLIVTYPSLYVFSALARSRLAAAETLRLLLAAVAVNLAVLASFGPVTAFFTVSTESYPFMVILNVVFFAVAGLVGLTFVQKALAAVFEPPAPPPGPLFEKPGAESGDAGTAPDSPPPPARARYTPPASPTAQRVFTVWLVIYAVVGAQMGWILRPFVGSPDLPFSVFRPRESSFFEAVLRALSQLFE